MKVFITKDGNSLYMNTDEERLPDSFLTDLDRVLSYTYRSRDNRGNLTVEKRLMYNILDTGKLVTTIGMWKTIRPVLKCHTELQFLFDDVTPSELNESKCEPDWDNVADLHFKPGQKEAVNSILNHNGGIICAPTGFGKTFLIGVLCKLFPKAKIHISTKSVEIANRIKNDLKRLVPSVGMIGGGKDEAAARVIVITADSLHKAPGDADLFFYDECHQAAAETYTQQILSTYQYAKRIGFTATPTGRSDGADPLLTMLFGEIIFDMGYQKGVELGLVVPIKVRWVPFTTPCPAVESYSRATSKKRYGIWRNEARNKLIANDVNTNYKDDTVLILVETVEHAVYLHKHLPDFTLCYATMTPDDLKFYKSKELLPEDYEVLSKADRMKLCTDFRNGTVKKVISTDVWSTGVDFPNLEVVYNVSSRISKILTTQGAGRVSRVFEGKSMGNVVDIQDTFADEFKAASYKRRKIYKDLKWEQEGYLGSRNGS